MKIILLGSGQMGCATVSYLLHRPEVKKLLLADASRSQLMKVKDFFKSTAHGSKLAILQLDLSAQSNLIKIMKAYDVIAAALPWPATVLGLNAATKACKPFVSITRPHYPDLELINLTVKESLALSILGCGLEPGLTEIFAVEAISHFSQVDQLHIRCGGIPLKPTPPLYHQSLFNSNGLPIEPRSAYFIEKGRLKTASRFSEDELIHYQDLGILEAWHDGMLPWLIDLPELKQATRVTQKTLRWPGFANSIRFLEKLGFLRNKTFKFRDLEVTPKELVDSILLSQLQVKAEDRDLVILDLELSGLQHGSQNPSKWRSIFKVFYDENRQLSAMAKATGYMLGITSCLIGKGEIKGKGLLRAENIFVGGLYQSLLEQLKEHDMLVQTQHSITA